MRIRIAEIDFALNQVWLDVCDGEESRDFTRLDLALTLARDRGFTDIRIHHRVGESHLMRRTLSEIARRHRVQITREKRWQDEPATNGVTSIAAAGDEVLYSMRFDDLDQAVERIGTAVMMIGIASGLDYIARNRLRFCAYELAVNAVEHGVFKDPPQIRIGLHVCTDTVEIAFRDNAAPFATDEQHTLDLTNKIARGEKRGLGLYILKQMGKSMSYVRAGRWNVTTMTTSPARSSSSSDRRHRMDSISIEMVACELPSTAVLKPVGSIDSSTAQVVENHLESAIEQGNTRIVLDLSEVDFVSSAGVGIFLGTVSRLRGAGGDLIFMEVPGQVQEVFDIINLKSYFRTITSIDALETVEQN
jgi:anti-anti-sigma factor